MSFRQLRMGILDSAIEAAGFTLTYILGSNSGANQQNYTFSSHSLGAVTTNKRNIVAASADGGGAVPNSLTVDGETCSELVSSADNTLKFYITDADITSTSGDIVLGTSASANRAGIRVYQAVDLTSFVADDNVIDAVAPFTGTIDVPASGALIAAILHGDGSAPSWTGVDADDNSAMESGQPAIGVGSRAYATLQSGITVAATGNVTQREFLAISMS